YSGISAVVPVKSWGWGSDETMSKMYDWYVPRIVNTKWDFTQYAADVVLVCLGENDKAGLQSGGSSKEFIAGYVQFIKDLRSVHPQADIVISVGPMGDVPSW